MTIFAELNPKKSSVILGLAIVSSGSALAMAAWAAWQRTGSPIDRGLMLASSCVLVGCVHVLPTFIKSRAAWVLWWACFGLAAFAHTGFFAFASERAAEAREALSPETLAIKARQQQITETLETIQARSPTLVSARLATAHSDDRRVALKIELAEAQRASALRDELVKLAAATGSSEAATDPVVLQLAKALGVNPETVGFVQNLIAAICLELVCCVLWAEVFKSDSPLKKPEPQACEKSVSQIDHLRAAVDSGQCKPTVSAIRAFLQCSQSKALQMRRELAINQNQKTPQISP